MKTKLDWMSHLTQVIEQNLTNPFLTNAELATMIGMSERQFYRKVESITGMSPNHYLRDIRLDRADELLKSGKFSTVKEIAMRVGFIKVSYFSKLYEEREGQRLSVILKKQQA
jgi:transcriptional regulator GlxA family with amidase domain